MTQAKALNDIRKAAEIELFDKLIETGDIHDCCETERQKLQDWTRQYVRELVGLVARAHDDAELKAASAAADARRGRFRRR